LIAIIPAVLVIILYGDEKIDALLVLSQVILSVQLGFAVIPLIHFVSDKKTMGEFAIKPLTQISAWLVAITLVGLNINMVIEQAKDLFEEEGMLGWKIAVVMFMLLFVLLFLAMTFLPIIKKKLEKKSSKIHSDTKELSNLKIHPFNKIAVALDFSVNDEKLIANALSQGGGNASYILLHIVESASAKYLGKDTDDEETRIDKERLVNYANQLKKLNYNVEIFIGYRNRINEIVRIVEESNADMLVMGAHHHTGLKDYLFGETIDAVRHKLKIPVLIINS